MATPVVPQASPATLPELATSRAPCAPRFRRSTSRASVERSLPGVRTALPRQNCATIAAAVAGTATARGPQLLTEAPGPPPALDPQRVQPRGAPSPPSGLRGLDAPGGPQQGRGSVGGARPYAGPRGQGAHGQGVVTAHDGADAPT